MRNGRDFISREDKPEVVGLAEKLRLERAPLISWVFVHGVHILEPPYPVPTALRSPQRPVRCVWAD